MIYSYTYAYVVQVHVHMQELCCACTCTYARTMLCMYIHISLVLWMGLDGLITSTAPRGMIPLVRGGSVGLNATILEA